MRRFFWYSVTVCEQIYGVLDLLAHWKHFRQLAETVVQCLNLQTVKRSEIRHGCGEQKAAAAKNPQNTCM